MCIIIIQNMELPTAESTILSHLKYSGIIFLCSYSSHEQNYKIHPDGNGYQSIHPDEFQPIHGDGYQLIHPDDYQPIPLDGYQVINL